MMDTIQHADGRVELKEEALREIEDSALYNHDLAPVPVAKRNWTTYNYAALWIPGLLVSFYDTNMYKIFAC